MSRDRNEQLADWLRYTEDPSYDPLPTYATPKEHQPSAAAEADMVAIITNHSKVDYAMLHEHAQVIFDARNAMKEVAKNSLKVVKL